MASRAELEQALKEGCAVDVGGMSCRNVKELPPDRADSPIEGTVTYDPQGNLTREGMELALKRGGSVLHQGEPVSDPAALPSAADLARHDAARAAGVRQTLLAQRAAIDADLAKLEQPREERFTQAPPEQPAREEPPRPVVQPPRVSETAEEGRRGKRGG